MTTTPAQDPRIGQVIKGYHLLSKLGDGGMGKVYLAEQLSVRRKVALKLLHPEFARDQEFVARFQQEAFLTAQLNHPRITTVFDFIDDDEGGLLIVMEYLQGVPLSEVIRTSVANGSLLSVQRAVRLGIQIAEGLAAAHNAGVVHRDVKPQNIMVTGPSDAVKLLDFGIARLGDATNPRMTRTGAMMGTPAYMAPEQIEGADVTDKTDIYALGIVLYEMLTGTPPFMGPVAMAILTKHLKDRVPPLRATRPDVPPLVEQVILQALEKEPEWRQDSMEHVARRLRAAVGLRADEALVSVSGPIDAIPGPTPPAGTPPWGWPAPPAPLPPPSRAVTPPHVTPPRVTPPHVTPPEGLPVPGAPASSRSPDVTAAVVSPPVPAPASSEAARSPRSPVAPQPPRPPVAASPPLPVASPRTPRPATPQPPAPLPPISTPVRPQAPGPPAVDSSADMPTVAASRPTVASSGAQARSTVAAQSPDDVLPARPAPPRGRLRMIVAASIAFALVVAVAAWILWPSPRPVVVTKPPDAPRAGSVLPQTPPTGGTQPVDPAPPPQPSPPPPPKVVEQQPPKEVRPPSIPPGEIRAAVERKLAAAGLLRKAGSDEPGVLVQNVDRNGVVTLAGVVRDEAKKDTVSRLAREVAGVKQVITRVIVAE